MAIMDSPSLGRFTSADSIVPGGVQGLDRYAYVNNNPVRYTDPSGHICREDGKGCESGASNEEIVRYTTRFIEENYSVKITGSWAVDELRNLSRSLDKFAIYLGGVDNLNTAFTNAAQSWDPDATGITIERVSGNKWNPSNKSDPSVAGWCGENDTYPGCSVNTLLIADDVFAKCYQFNTCGGPSYARPATFTLEERIQFTFAHEFTHVLADANPISVSVYKAVWNGIEEDMANEVALDAISQGSLTTQFSTWAADYGFWNYP